MTARKLLVIECDRDDCEAYLAAVDDESLLDLRRRAHRDNGWRSIPSLRDGGHTDLCRWHS